MADWEAFVRHVSEKHPAYSLVLSESTLKQSGFIFTLAPKTEFAHSILSRAREEIEAMAQRYFDTMLWLFIEPISATDEFFFIGIDPGQSGAICRLWSSGKVELWDMPESEQDLATLILSIKAGVRGCVLEDVHAMPKQGVSSTFKFGVNCGLVRGVLAAAGIPFERITPTKWQKAVLDSPKKGDDIKKSVWLWARRCFPEADIAGARGAMKFGRSDALGMAVYARQRVGA